jgi:hypothetical protein
MTRPDQNINSFDPPVAIQQVTGALSSASSSKPCVMSEYPSERSRVS